MAPGELPTGTVTFLLTDVEGSTRLWEQHPQAMRQALALHDAMAASCVMQHAGTLIKARGQGDSLFAVFTRATDGVAAACELQRSLCCEPWPPDAPIRVRMAVHTGEADLVEADYLGSAVNRCARMRDVGHGGQLLLSETTAQLVRDSLPGGAGLLDLGPRSLRDLARPERIYQLTHPELPSQFRPLRSLDVLPNNLKRQLTSFVGREKAMADVKQLLAGSCLLTLTGTGGCGKTRLALQVAADVLDHYPDGVWLVELASLSDPELVPGAIAAAVGVRPEPDRPLTGTLIEDLRSKSLLLVVDNCEHLVQAVARVVEELLRACADLRVLATSREALGIAGEVSWQVPSMPAPDPRSLEGKGSRQAVGLERYEAVRLFVERVHLFDPGFRVTADNALAVAQICHRLDGIPFAIELAAARVRVLSVKQVSARLTDRFGLLTAGARTALPRYKTLGEAIDWSYDLLTAAERALLCRLAVFAGGWTIEAAEAVCADGEALCSEQILDLLSRLVDKSLVVKGEGIASEARYRLLETIRQYALHRLDDGGETGTLRDRHRAWYLSFAEEADPHLAEPDPTAWLDRLELEYDNLRAALAWSVAAGDRLRLATALTRFWLARGRLSEGRSWLEGALARSADVDPAVRAKALNAVAVLAWSGGDYAAMRSALAECLPIRRSLGVQAQIIATLNNLGIAASEQRDYALARACYEECLPYYRGNGDLTHAAQVQSNLAGIASEEGDYETAVSLFNEALTTQRALGNRQDIATVLHNLGMIACRLGEPGRAGPLLHESLAISGEVRDGRAIANALSGLGIEAVSRPDPARAACLFGAAEAAREAAGSTVPPSEREDCDRAIAAARSALGDPAFEEEWARGAALTQEEAVALGLETGRCDPGESGPPGEQADS